MATIQRVFKVSSVSNVLKRMSSSTSFTLSASKAKTQEGQDEIVNQLKRNEEIGSHTELMRDFLDAKEFHNSVKNSGIDFFCGVPDSLLKDYCGYVADIEPKEKHIISANEGGAVAIASGYHMATGKTPMVYLQNSGLGNIVNPIMSLALPAVYSIPMLLFVGWRGEPGKRDEPQHQAQGKSTPGLLAACGIPFQVLPDYQEGAEQALYTARKHMEITKGPYCMLVKRQTFLPYKQLGVERPDYPLNREGVIKAVVSELSERDVVVGTTGMLSRELFEFRKEKNMGHEKDFLTVGSMGHASAIALGISLQRPTKQVFCLDGDGAALMHLGNMSTVAANAKENFKHIIINNNAHDSVGGQLTDCTDDFDFPTIALGLGYKQALTATTPEEITHCVRQMRQAEGPILLEIKCRTGSRKDLGRPTRTPLQNKADFMHFLAIE